MVKHRKYDWLALIQYNEDMFEFKKYQMKHRGISLNRCARAFCQKKKYVKWSIFDNAFMDRLEKDLDDYPGYPDNLVADLGD